MLKNDECENHYHEGIGENVNLEFVGKNIREKGGRDSLIPKGDT